MSETKTIKSLTPPEEGTKRPGFVAFSDGTVAKYWPNAPWAVDLRVGATAPALLEDKDSPRGVETFLKQWGDAPQRKGGFGGGRQPRSPEETRSIAAQACIKAACELFHGTGDMQGAGKAVRGFMKLHDDLVAGKTPEAGNV